MRRSRAEVAALELLDNSDLSISQRAKLVVALLETTEGRAARKHQRQMAGTRQELIKLRAELGFARYGDGSDDGRTDTPVPPVDPVKAAHEFIERLNNKQKGQTI